MLLTNIVQGMMKDQWTCFAAAAPFSRFEHCLQTATRAERDGAQRVVEQQVVEQVHDQVAVALQSPAAAAAPAVTRAASPDAEEARPEA